jgi:hypothetical protein
MASNKNPRQITEGKLRCGSKRHEGDRMVPVESFTKKVTSPDGLSYDCKECRIKYNAERGSESYLRYKNKDRIKHMFLGSRGRAKQTGTEFSLELSDIIVPEFCPVLGIPLVFSEKRTHNTPSIDRIINTEGYTKDNSIVVSWRANLLKKDATIQELLNISNFYTQIIETRGI